MYGHDRVTLNTDLGEFYLDPGWQEDFGVEVEEEEFEVTLDAPELDDDRELDRGCVLTVRFPGVLPSQVPPLLQLTAFVTRVAEQINEANEGAAEKARAEQQRRAEEAERRAAERQETLAHRKERLMTEFIGETVVIREEGYKTMRAAVVDVVPVKKWNDEGEYVETGEYRLHFAYTGRDVRTQQLSRMRRMDVKVGGRRMTLWDDGKDDVWGDLAASANPVPEYDGRLSS